MWSFFRFQAPRTDRPMYALMLTLIILDGIFLSVVILLQSGKGGGLAAMGGSGSTMTEGILGGRQATTVLTRATWISGTIFLVLALLLSIMSSRAAAPESVIRVDAPATAPAPEPVLPGLPGDAPPPAGEDPSDAPGN